MNEVSGGRIRRTFSSIPLAHPLKSLVQRPLPWNEGRRNYCSLVPCSGQAGTIQNRDGPRNRYELQTPHPLEAYTRDGEWAPVASYICILGLRTPTYDTLSSQITSERLHPVFADGNELHGRIPFHSQGHRKSFLLTSTLNPPRSDFLPIALDDLRNLRILDDDLSI